MRTLILWAAFASALLGTSCGRRGEGDARSALTDDELVLLRRLGPLPSLPPSPTNAFAERPEAQRLGKRLFFDTGLSSDGTISCASCHDAAHGFADPRALSLGVRGQQGVRHASTLLNAAYNRFFFWDGRADSLWSQPLKAFENELEADFSRCEVLHRIASNYREDWELLFGPLPKQEQFPARCMGAEHEAMPEAVRAEVDRVFANVGKVIEAYVRLLVSKNSRLDRYLAGEAGALSPSELRGARLFVREERGNCIACHDGPNLTDDSFHVLGIPQRDGELDTGRYDGIVKLLKDPFNGDGRFSDSPGGRMNGLVPRTVMKGQFKTPTLRGVSQRAPYGHLGSFATLEEFIRFHERGGGDPATERFVGVKELLVKPVTFTDGERADLIAFLRALDGEALSAELTARP